jgi:membrane-bound serine protease (ClpP class)
MKLMLNHLKFPFLLFLSILFAASESYSAVVHRIDLNGTIDALHAEYVIRAIDLAEAADSDLVLIKLNTPGGMVESMELMGRRVLSSKAPVAVWVGPSGTRAASAGFFLLVTADVAAMAPGTRTGAAHPILSIGGFFPIDPGKITEPGKPKGEDTEEAEKTPKTFPQGNILMEKVSNDIQAYLRAVTAVRDRNGEAAELAVSESRSYTEVEALELKLIEFVASTEADLLKQLDGREIKRIDGTITTLSLSEATIIDVPMTFREKALSFLVNPNVAFLLLLLGVLLIYVEVTHAGMILPGVVGGLALLLAVTGFSFLPLNAAGVLLIIAAFGLFIAEVFVQSFGLLAVAGAVSLAIGAIILVDMPEQGVSVDPKLAIVTAIAFAAITVFLGVLAVRSLRKRVTTGAEGAIDQTAKVLADFGPGEGPVMYNGEYWKARSDSFVQKDSQVRIKAVEGLTLVVEPVEY